ncbi:MAG: 3-deoxy-D-manno-octulosonic acid transferase [Rhodospirillales bacterium]|jgi:3-deoxy-D-manno-octulosonic-acid transferase|nr:3-deoxy-D-manno-octulosonic acid transferase [Rhodospirillales bacterium]
MMLSLYRAATTVGAPLIHLYLARRRSAGKEDRERFGERLGQAALSRPQGRLVWAHAASVGESLSLLTLIGRLLEDRPGLHGLVTTGTVTSARLMAERLPARAFHQYVPVDRVAYVRRFLDHWKPDLVLWAESEFWPNLVSQTAARRVPMVLVNGRVSAASFAGWRRAPGLIRHLLGGFALCLGQTEEDTARLWRLGAPRVACPGNLKFAAAALPADDAEIERLGAAIGARPRWLAASTHPGEEEIAGRVHRRLAAGHPDLLTVIVPRHPDRGPAIAADLRGAGLAVAVRSAGDAVAPRTGIYVADTMGELGLFYRLADIAFMGKSLVPLGGQNALEAARLGCAVVQGPNVGNFAEMARRMKESGAAIEVADEDGLATAVGQLLDNGGERARRVQAAISFASAEAHVLDDVMAELRPFLDALHDGGESHAGA